MDWKKLLVYIARMKLLFTRVTSPMETSAMEQVVMSTEATGGVCCPISPRQHKNNHRQLLAVI